MDDGSAATTTRDASLAALYLSVALNVAVITSSRPCEAHFLFATFFARVNVQSKCNTMKNS